MIQWAWECQRQPPAIVWEIMMKVDTLHTVSEWQVSWRDSFGRTQNDRKMGEYWKSKDHVEAVQDQRESTVASCVTKLLLQVQGRRLAILMGVTHLTNTYLHTFKQSSKTQRPYMTNTRFLMMFKVHNSCHNPSELPISRYRIGFEYFRRANPLAWGRSKLNWPWSPDIYDFGI